MKDLALDEITLRKYEIIDARDRREIAKKFCLSLGLLQEGDSRDIIVDVLLVLLESKKEKKLMDSEEIKEKVKEIRRGYGLSLKGISSSNIRRQIKKLRDLFLVERVKGKYRISEFENIEKIFSQKIRIKIESIIERIKEYAKLLDNL
jgi:hypothetical protein